MKKLWILGALAALCCACGPQGKGAQEAPERDSTAVAADSLVLSAADRQLLDSIDGMEGVRRTASGLRYRVMAEAEGDHPSESDTILVGYRGLHADGSLFWEDEGEEFSLKGTIAGFREGVALMAPGAKYELYIPSALGYGSKGIEGLIAPDEPLIYEVTLISFRK